jgi:hypothetical protein
MQFSLLITAAPTQAAAQGKGDGSKEHTALLEKATAGTSNAVTQHYSTAHKSRQ